MAAGLECVIYMGAEDMRRQALNVFRMRLLGATVQPVTAGTATLKDATRPTSRPPTTSLDPSLVRTPIRCWCGISMP